MESEIYEKDNVMRFFSKLRIDIQDLNEKLKEDINQTKDFTNIKETLQVILSRFDFLTILELDEGIHWCNWPYCRQGISDNGGGGKKDVQFWVVYRAGYWEVLVGYWFCRANEAVKSRDKRPKGTYEERPHERLQNLHLPPKRHLISIQNLYKTLKNLIKSQFLPAPARNIQFSL